MPNDYGTAFAFLASQRGDAIVSAQLDRRQRAGVIVLPHDACYPTWRSVHSFCCQVVLTALGMRSSDHNQIPEPVRYQIQRESFIESQRALHIDLQKHVLNNGMYLDIVTK